MEKENKLEEGITSEEKQILFGEKNEAPSNLEKKEIMETKENLAGMLNFLQSIEKRTPSVNRINRMITLFTNIVKR